MPEYGIWISPRGAPRIMKECHRHGLSEHFGFYNRTSKHPDGYLCWRCLACQKETNDGANYRQQAGCYNRER